MNDDPTLRPQDDGENKSNPEQDLPASAYTLGRLDEVVSERLGDARDEPEAIFTFDIKDKGVSGYKTLVIEPKSYRTDDPEVWTSNLTFRFPDEPDVYIPEKDEYVDTDPDGDYVDDTDLYVEFKMTHNRDGSFELTKQTVMDTLEYYEPIDPRDESLIHADQELSTQVVSEAEARQVIGLVRTAKFIEQG